MALYFTLGSLTLLFRKRTMPQKKKLPPFDFFTCSVEEAKGAILARLDVSGPGHTAYCLVRGAAHSRHSGCPCTPLNWAPPAPMLAALRAMKASGTIAGIGAYLWLRPGRSAAKLEAHRGVAQWQSNGLIRRGSLVQVQSPQ